MLSLSDVTTSMLSVSWLYGVINLHGWRSVGKIGILCHSMMLSLLSWRRWILVYSHISPAMQNCWSMLKMNLCLVCTLAVLVGWESEQTFALKQLGLTSEHFSSWVARGRVRTAIFHKSWLKSLTNVFKKVVKPLYFQLKAGTSWEFAGTRIGEMVLNCLTSLWRCLYKLSYFYCTNILLCSMKERNGFTFCRWRWL